MNKDMGLLEGKVALITGAARGIGKAIALRFAAEGADIAFTDLAIDDDAKATLAEIRALGAKAEAYASNAADFAQTQETVAEIAAEFGRIDILVNNAGITRDSLVMRMSEEQWDDVINVNLKSAFNFIHAVVPVMSRQKGGSIINMSSVAGQMGNAGQVNYSASKAGLVAMAKSVAREMGSRGIRANAIAPGFVISAMTDALPEVEEGDETGYLGTLENGDGQLLHVFIEHASGEQFTETSEEAYGRILNTADRIADCLEGRNGYSFKTGDYPGETKE